MQDKASENVQSREILREADVQQYARIFLTNSAKRLWSVFYMRRYSLTGSALARVSIALVFLLLIGANYNDRNYYWGPSGGIPLSVYAFESSYAKWLLYGFHDSDLYFQLIFHLQIIVAVAYLIGYRCRITGPIFYFMLLSLFERNTHILNAGTNLIMAVSPFLALIDSSRYLSVDSILRKRRRRTLSTSHIRGSVYGTLIHNFSILLIAFQISVMYFMAGVNKIQGPLWMKGEAVYYILSSPLYGIHVLDDFLSQHMLVTAVLTYSTMLFQVAFPVLVYLKLTRTIILAVAATFHISIAIVMGLADFSFFMISIELLIIDDAHYHRFLRLLRRNKPAPLRVKRLRRYGWLGLRSHVNVGCRQGGPGW